jgi:branched-subunit amino acid aminotransferase/4-amino-4-deoxychorismate lyase
MELKRITKENLFEEIGHRRGSWQENYLAMYSSQWKGVTTDPDLMTLPSDDHLVHRGDGVFDVIRCVQSNVYQMEEHLQRLERSARAISLELPPDYKHVRRLIKHLVLLGGEKDCLIRAVLSRGPGSFTTNPYDCPSSQLYIHVIRFQSLPEAYYREGVAIITSRIPIKKSFFANIKSCNYLPNVLMKMEAIKAGCAYSVALDEDGFLAEGSTENIGVLTADRVLKFPEFERTLSGITANRVYRLSGQLVKQGLIREVRFAKIPLSEAHQAKEVVLTGTSLGVLPVTTYDGNRIGEGTPGPAYSELSRLLWKDMTENRELLTQIAGP